MIQPDIDIAAAALHPDVQALDLSMFGPQDLVNLVLQRSEVLFDQPKSGRIIKAWSEGDGAPMHAAIDKLGPEIARRAAGVVHAEFLTLLPLLRDLAPRRIADIGCGYALFDLFAARELGCDLLLIDLEDNGQRHFGFTASGSAYSNLATARRFLETNGVPQGTIRTLNPKNDDLESAGKVDLAVSFLACGFHFPVTPYLEFFTHHVSASGAVLVDLRRTTAAEQRAQLAPLGQMQEVPTQPKAERILVRKGQG